MNAPGGRWATTVAVLVIFLAAAGVAVVLGSGALTPAPSAGPVPLPSTPVADLAGSPLAPPTPTVAPTPGGETPIWVPSVSPGSSARPVVAKRISIPSLGIDLPIYAGDGVTALLGKVAHYPGTSWPGGGSLVYLYGHARDQNLIGLWEAKVGDSIELTLADGDTAAYRISRIRPAVAWDDMSMTEPTATELLRIQTCTSYEETAPRFIVDAVPSPSHE